MIRISITSDRPQEGKTRIAALITALLARVLPKKYLVVLVNDEKDIGQHLRNVDDRHPGSQTMLEPCANSTITQLIAESKSTVVVIYDVNQYPPMHYTPPENTQCVVSVRSRSATPEEA